VLCEQLPGQLSRLSNQTDEFWREVRPKVLGGEARRGALWYLAIMRQHRPHRVALDVLGLIGIKDIFRLSEGAKRDRVVDAWLADVPVELRSIAQKWFVRMRECGEDVGEQMHDGCPVACIENAPFGYVNSFKFHVNVGFFYGAALADPAGLLEGSGKRMRHVKLRPDCEFNAAALGDLIDAAYSDIKARLGAELR
jgi:hypothetical protein